MSEKQKNSQTFNEKQAAKKAAVMETGKNKKKIYIIGVIALFTLIILGAGGYVFTKFGKSPESVALAKEITHPVNLFDDGQARHFQIDIGNNVTVKYFVLKSSDGVIRAAFDACDVCWPSGKGYYQSGDYMVCRNCGKRFASIKVNVVKGGCNPAPLNREVVGENLVIQIRDIVNHGRKYFDFTGRV